MIAPNPALADDVEGKAGGETEGKVRAPERIDIESVTPTAFRLALDCMYTGEVVLTASVVAAAYAAAAAIAAKRRAVRAVGAVKCAVCCVRWEWLVSDARVHLLLR